MSQSKSTKQFHPRNLHNDPYDFKRLISTYPDLSKFISINQYQNESINFADSNAVKVLNAALLNHYYQIKNWDIPQGALCPPIPGRADYIHYVADLLNEKQPNDNIKLLDIGTGANGIYPLLASQIYNWRCTGSDISQPSIDNVERIIGHNPNLKNKVECRIQSDKHKIFAGIIKQDEKFDVSVCNPPFHESEQDAIKSSTQKNKNLNIEIESLNFGGQANELWCNGGEKLFLKKMIKESAEFSTQIKWFTSLVSKKENLKPTIKLINKLGAKQVKEIEMIQGNKKTRILAWTFV
ncbi:23S rRNA (adenine(1618)-N(6))-methyltransferase RlmF [Marinicellulosiphila megalodicopiae]|uniref:23S rRNA (adenine(1618)-N(6))-methyltransferase RlmF n=1 Tax=Marinicellulosiphila megalodicopiae TaxID=2724896 RepID=UPI003BAE8813